MPSDKWLVVGLGNPGENYRFTRHNVGFRAVEGLVVKYDVNLREKDESIFGSFSLEGQEVFLLFPQTFMNDSGRAVAPFIQYRNLPLDHLLVVSDDLDLPVGKMRMRTAGGSGGHHGLDSLIAHLGSSEFPRLRIGISKPPSGQPGRDHVLASFTPEETPKIEEALLRSQGGMVTWILKGPAAAMRELNRDPDSGEDPANGV
jgi:PTH1 family peptidyl-tRNA hydrolase